MKIIKLIILSAVLSIALHPCQAWADSKKSKVESGISTLTSKKQLNLMAERVIEIKAMDKSQLNISEKKALKNELKMMKQTIRHSSPGIYLSAGALIVIIILLILIL